MEVGIRLLVTVVAAFAITFAASKIMIPWLKKKKAGQHVREDGPQTHLVKEGTPTMGGIMMVIGIVLATLCFSVYSDNAALTVIFLLAAMLLFTMIGFWDDSVKLFQKRSLGLRAWQKIVLQLGVAALIACLSYFMMGSSSEILPFAKVEWNLGIGQIPFTMFVFISMVNSVNLTDGLDGLATSITLVNALAFIAVMIFAIPGGALLAGGATGSQVDIAVFACALAGACVAFLCFNKHPAKVFMGDTGSFALGSSITVIAAAMRVQLLLPMMGLMFVLSAVSVIIQVGSFKLRGKRVFKMAPLHHHFELCGIKETRVVLGYVLISVILSVMSVLSMTL